MKIRFAKVFSGKKNKASYQVVLQEFDSFFGRWETVKTEWASKKDEELYLAALNNEQIKEYR